MTAIRLAMWSGPRNISTALMRSFAARGDCEVVDEPLYGCYLATTGLKHPGREEVLAVQSSEWESVVAALHRDGDRPIRYVKHMAHHLTDDIGRNWLAGWRHAFLLREPAAMLASLAKVLPFVPRLIDTGLPQQVELSTSLGGPIIAAEDVLEDPETMLAALCASLDIPWTPSMLSWPEGPHPADGVWARHWYDAVWASTGFSAPRSGPTDLDPALQPVLDAAQPLYDQLWNQRLSR